MRGPNKKKEVKKPEWLIPINPYQFDYGFGPHGLGIYLWEGDKIVKFIKDKRK